LLVKKKPQTPSEDAISESIEVYAVTAVEIPTVPTVRAESAKKYAEKKQPSAKIQAVKPTSIPNAHYNRVEMQTRRKIATSSAKEALGKLLIHPSRPCDFGKIVVGERVVREFWVSNSGNDSTRIKVQTSGDGVTAEWQVGPIAPGMRRKVSVTVNAKKIQKTGQLQGIVKVVGEAEILEIKVVGEVVASK
jgi:hypothetical protein